MVPVAGIVVVAVVVVVKVLASSGGCISPVAGAGTDGGVLGAAGIILGVVLAAVGVGILSSEGWSGPLPTFIGRVM